MSQGTTIISPKRGRLEVDAVVDPELVDSMLGDPADIFNVED
jgi:hypothetical protein